MSHETPLVVSKEQSDQLSPYSSEDIRDARHQAEGLRAWSREQSNGATTLSDRDIVRLMREAARKEAEEKGDTSEVAIKADQTRKILAILAGLDPETEEIPNNDIHFPF